MGDKLTHIDEAGAARMVDISAKAMTYREATAAGEHANGGHLDGSRRRVRGTGPAHQRVHRPVDPRQAPEDRGNRAQHPSGRRGRGFGLDRTQFGADVSNRSDIGIANHMH